LRLKCLQEDNITSHRQTSRQANKIYDMFDYVSRLRCKLRLCNSPKILQFVRLGP